MMSDVQEVAVPTITIRTKTDIVEARRAGRELADHLGFSKADQTRLATSISELARNVIQNAGEGICIIKNESDMEKVRIVVVIEDHGPGIPDIDNAMQDGFSTSGGLGAGLPGTKRLVQEFNVETEPGHTVVTIAISRRRR